MGTLSYSLHIDSSRGTSGISTKNDLSARLKHNLRSYEKEGKKVEVLKGGSTASQAFKDFKKAYKDLFQEAVTIQDLKQKDKRYLIGDYFEHISKSKSTFIATEVIIQVGHKDFWEGKTLEDKEKVTPLFKKQLEKLEEVCPNFKAVSAVVHYDEASPHMQVLGIPFKEGYKKGLQKRVSKKTAFSKESLTKLQESMREGVEDTMKSIYGHDIDIKAREKGRNRSVTPSEYKKAMDIALEDKKALEGQIDALKGQSDELALQKSMLLRETGFLQAKKEGLHQENESLEKHKKEREEYEERLESGVKPNFLGLYKKSDMTFLLQREAERLAKEREKELEAYKKDLEKKQEKELEKRLEIEKRGLKKELYKGFDKLYSEVKNLQDPRYIKKLVSTAGRTPSEKEKMAILEAKRDFSTSLVEVGKEQGKDYRGLAREVEKRASKKDRERQEQKILSKAKSLETAISYEKSGKDF